MILKQLYFFYENGKLVINTNLKSDLQTDAYF